MSVLDPEIRAALVAHLAATEPSPAILNEVPIRYARGRYTAGRADVLAVSDVVAGYEIKSDADGRSRLDRQVLAYGALCDFCTIVVGPRHLAHVRSKLPASWGILVAEPRAQGLFLRRERFAECNADVEPAAIARQFWKGECVALLKKHGAKIDRRALVHDIWPLVEALPLDVLRAALRVALVAHENALKDNRPRLREIQRKNRHHEKDLRAKREEWAARTAEILARPKPQEARTA